MWKIAREIAPAYFGVFGNFVIMLVLMLLAIGYIGFILPLLINADFISMFVGVVLAFVVGGATVFFLVAFLASLEER